MPAPVFKAGIWSSSIRLLAILNYTAYPNHSLALQTARRGLLVIGLRGKIQVIESQSLLLAWKEDLYNLFPFLLNCYMSFILQLSRDYLFIKSAISIIAFWLPAKFVKEIANVSNRCTPSSYRQYQTKKHTKPTWQGENLINIYYNNIKVMMCMISLINISFSSCTICFKYTMVYPRKQFI